MKEIMKNINKSEVLRLKEQVAYLPGQITSKTLVQDDNHSLTLFAFDAGEEISTHESGGDAMVVVLDGTGKITIDGQVFMVEEGQSIVMPAKVPHAVEAVTPYKMLLIVFFAEE